MTENPLMEMTRVDLAALDGVELSPEFSRVGRSRREEVSGERYVVDVSCGHLIYVPLHCHPAHLPVLTPTGKAYSQYMSRGNTVRPWSSGLFPGCNGRLCQQR